MNLFFLIIMLCAPLLAGYLFYGRILRKFLHLDNACPTPAHTLSDGVDFEPAGKWYLLGQHLSAIAAAGPIIGPILAGMWFGWAPAVVWIIIGGIFIGGVHDMCSLVASVRHQGRSIAEVVKEQMTHRAFILFLLFLWFSLMYIITAFADITAGTFAAQGTGGKVASSSMMYLGLAVIMGILVHRLKANLSLMTGIFIALVVCCIWLGNSFPFSFIGEGAQARLIWNRILLFYCFVASVVPVWLLLQPRGYLGGFFLTVTILMSFIGIIVGSFTKGFSVQYPAFIGWENSSGLPLMPLLFTTIACGACSGFHALVSTGTTSKQLDKESDACAVGYGGMLLESVVALIALATLMGIGLAQANELKDPNIIYANGIASFLNVLGIDKTFALNFALLAFATFVYDTLDVATRLGRYIFEELLGKRGRWTAYVASFCTLLLPYLFLMQKAQDAQGQSVPAWKVFWTVFGSSNQLLAGFVLLALSVWMYKKGMRFLFLFIPAVFMLSTSLTSLVYAMRPAIISLAKGRFVLSASDITAVVLLMLSVLLLWEAAAIFVREKTRRLA